MLPARQQIPLQEQDEIFQEISQGILHCKLFSALFSISFLLGA